MFAWPDGPLAGRPGLQRVRAWKPRSPGGAQWVRACPRVAPHDDVGGKPSATGVLLVRAH
jgi:hypothetical protein